MQLIEQIKNLSAGALIPSSYESCKNPMYFFLLILKVMWPFIKKVSLFTRFRENVAFATSVAPLKD